MNTTRIALCALVPALLISCGEKPSEGFSLVPRPWAYSIKQHNDSIYFSTSEDGVFRFHPDNPGAVVRVAGNRKLPFRSLAFTKDQTLLASSYYAGVHYAQGDTMLPLRWAPYECWSMKLDENGLMWCAGSFGVFRQKADSLVRFVSLREAHDVALYKEQCAIAHLNGVSILDRESGRPIREFCKGVIFWTVTTMDSLFIAGGLNQCLIINQNNCRNIWFGPPGNMAWAIERDSLGTLYLGTQKGLFRCATGSDTAECMAMEGTCIKSLLIDNRGRLWAGRFYSKKRGR
jgi:ligand-binding sensor domain-containing protein